MTKAEFLNKIYNTNLPSRAVTVIFYLVNRANKEMICFPAIKTIAKECSISVRTVRRALKDLVDKGLLKKDTRWRENGGQSSNLYTLQIEVKPDEDKHINNDLANENGIEDKEVLVSNQADIEHIDFSYYINEGVKSDSNIKSKIDKQDDINKNRNDNDTNELENIDEHCSNNLLNEENNCLNLKDNILSIVRKNLYKFFIRAENGINFYLAKLKEGYWKNKVTGGG